MEDKKKQSLELVMNTYGALLVAERHLEALKKTNIFRHELKMNCNRVLEGLNQSLNELYDVDYKKDVNIMNDNDNIPFQRSKLITDFIALITKEENLEPIYKSIIEINGART